MILYYVVTTCHLLSAILHKNKYYKNKKSVLIITKSIVIKYPNYTDFFKYFNDIIISEMTFVDNYNNKKYFKKVLKENKYSMNNFEEIFAGGAQHNFGIYLAENKIPFHFFEEGLGMLSRSENLKNIDMKLSPERTKIALDNGLYTGENKVIKKVILNKYIQLKDFDVNKPNYEHFDPVEELHALSENERAELLDIFNVNIKIDIPENSVLILTLHFANLKMLSFEEQANIYQILADYFCDGYNLVFKPHPDDIMYYDILFPEAQIIREVFPSEFLPFVLTKEPAVFATISSTSIFAFKNIYKDKILEFPSPDYQKDFVFTHRYYIALEIINRLNNSHSICSLGANEDIIDNFLSYGDFKNSGLNINNLQSIDTASSKKQSIILIDDIMKNSDADFLECVEDVIHYMKNIDGNSAVIFINSMQDFCFYDIFAKELWEDIIPIVINKKALKDDEFYSDTETEIVYLYTKNEEYKKMAKDVNVKKTLKHTGLEISVKPFETKEELRIKVLEGILAATEKRLLHYINKEKEREENK